ncbi:uncharacterized protein LOC113162260 [Anabas testudineus]|uniref:uncharacterized protein LOC113162260 n=1 Tax=Anabas testudineus TaxID=64144 RepID=UPI000E456C48|nr:uncharacterized protein LOC113162260 [Anabas testudineus]
MPQNHIIFEGRRRAARHHTCKANGPIPGAGLVNGPIAPDGCKAAAPSTSESTPAVTPTGTKPQLVLNGYINHRYKGRNAKLAPNEGRRTSAVTDASAAARASGGGIPGDVSVNGVTTVDADAYSHNSDQMTPEYRLSAAMKNKRSKKFRRKKRDTKVVNPENCKLRYFPPQKEENWENEIQDSTLTNGETMCFGVKPYGPEDVLQFALRDFTLKQRDTVDLPATTSYSPAVHHPNPVEWLCCRINPEPDQFADAEE